MKYSNRYNRNKNKNIKRARITILFITICVLVVIAGGLITQRFSTNTKTVQAFEIDKDIKV